MATAQDTQADLLSTIFDNNIVKGMVAAVTVVGVILRYLKGAGARVRHSTEIAKRYHFGPVFAVVSRLPHWIHLGVAYAVLVGALLEAGLALYEVLLGGASAKLLPPWVMAAPNFISAHFIGLFILAFLLYLAFELRLIERVLGWSVGLVPYWRQSFAWPNAMWQIEGDKDAPVLGYSKEAAERVVNEIIAALTTTVRSPSLALRPLNLSEDSAANVLYFGHVLEEYCSETLHRSFAWTLFYQALANVAETLAAPFAPETLRERPLEGGFFVTLLAANAHLDAANQIPNDAGLEAAVDDAFKKLRMRWDGDARAIVSGFSGTDYRRVLSGSRHFLALEAMRRQFAKLFILWTIKPRASHPAVFRIPFSTGIFMKYLDEGVLLAEGSRFGAKAERVALCFEAGERAIVQRAFELLQKTNDATRVAWRDAERQDVVARKIDWTWWVYYRSDTQAYANSRGHKSTQWKRQGEEIVAAKQG